MRIRPAALQDAKALARLRFQAESIHARLLPDYFRVPAGMPPPDDPGGGGDGSHAAILVADDGEGARGYVAVRLVDTPRDPAVQPCRRAHVETVVVDEAHRGLGIGTALMRGAAAWARRRGAAEVVLTVWSENAAAEALYRRLGYQPIARVLRKPTAE